MKRQKLKPEILREYTPTQKEVDSIKRNPIVLVLDRIVDTYNVGSLYRLADAIAAEKMILCGEMEYPPNHRIHKAAVGVEKWVPWEKAESTIVAVQDLKLKGYHTLAVEQSENSVSYKDLNLDVFKFPVAIVAGHETEGLSKEVLEEVDTIVEFPMYGINNSFNVWGSTAVVCYKILESL